MIYADNAATTKLDESAFLAMKPFLLESYANASQPYSFSRSAKKALNDARETIAACINAYPDEIYFTSGGTESNNWAIKSIAVAGACERKYLLSSAIEHHAVLQSCHMLSKAGHTVFLIPVDGSGVVQENAYSDLLQKHPYLVSVMLANNEIGSIQPVKSLCTSAHKVGALFHTDAVQGIGHIPIDVKDLGVDFLSASAHKFNGPKGVGFLFIRRGLEIPSFHNGGGQEGGMRAGTENIASIVGMATALRNNCRMISQTSSRLQKFESELIDAFQDAGLDFIRNGNINHIPGNISISFCGKNGEMLLHRLDLKGICVSTGAACDSKRTQISHVLKAIHIPDEYAKGTIRITLGRYNTSDEVEKIAHELIKIVKEKRH